MKIYYLDEKLSQEELEFIKKSMVDFEDLRSIQDIKQIKISSLLPAPDKNGTLTHTPEELINIAVKNLIKSGIEKENGAQIVWVMPKEIHWNGIFQMAIMNITGFSPYMVQRWLPDEEGRLTVKGLRIIDGHGLFGNKE